MEVIRRFTGTVADATSIAVAPVGGVAATNVQAALAELDTEKQPLSDFLTAVVGLATNGLIEKTGANTAAIQALSTLGRALLNAASEVAARTAIGAAADAEVVHKTGDTLTGALVLADTPGALRSGAYTARLRSDVANAATAVGFSFDTLSALTVAGSKLVEFSHGGTTYFSASPADGRFRVGANITAGSGVHLGDTISGAATSPVNIGTNLVTEGTYAVNIGRGNTVGATFSPSLAAGNNITVTGSAAAAVGFAIRCSGLGATVLGTSSGALLTNTLANSVMLGFGQQYPAFYSEQSRGFWDTALVGVGSGAALDTGEQVPNGTFTGGATSWTLGTGWAYGTDNITHTAGTAGDATVSVTGLVSGVPYRLAYTTSGVTGGEVTPSLSGATAVTFHGRADNATVREVFVATGATATLKFAADASFAGSIDDVSVKRLLDGRLAVASHLFVNGSIYLNLKNSKLLARSTGPGPSCGLATLAAGTVTVSTSSATANSIVLPVARSAGSGVLSVTTAAGSLTINSSDPADTRQVGWFLVEPL